MPATRAARGPTHPGVERSGSNWCEKSRDVRDEWMVRAGCGMWLGTMHGLGPAYRRVWAALTTTGAVHTQSCNLDPQTSDTFSRTYRCTLHVARCTLGVENRLTNRGSFRPLVPRPELTMTVRNSNLPPPLPVRSPCVACVPRCEAPDPEGVSI